MMRLLKLLAMVLLCASAAAATTLTGGFVTPDGNGVTGTIELLLSQPGANTCLHQQIVPTLTTYRLSNGGMPSYAAVVGNDCLQPLNTWYTVRVYDRDGTLLMSAPYEITGATFDFNNAVPTTITTNQVSYLNPISAANANTFTAQQTFNVGIIDTDPVAGLYMAHGAMVEGRNNANSAYIPAIGVSLVNGADNVVIDPSGIGTTIGTNGAGVQVTGVGAARTVAAVGPLADLNLEAASGAGATFGGGDLNLESGNAISTGTPGNLNVLPGQNGSVIGNIDLGGPIKCNVGAACGVQSVRAASCTTGAGAGSTCNTTVSWPSSFSASSYTAVCTVDSPTGTPYVLNTFSKTAVNLVVTIANLTAVASSGTLNCWGAL